MQTFINRCKLSITMITSLSDSSGINQMNEEIKRYEMSRVPKYSSKVSYSKNGIQVTIENIVINGKVIFQKVQAKENGIELDAYAQRTKIKRRLWI